jgi:type II secretory pathway pseudopilin PulG
MKKDILVIILVLLIGAGVIFGVYQIDKNQKISRALKRAQDLNFIKQELEKYKYQKGEYPKNNFSTTTNQNPVQQKSPALPISATTYPSLGDSSIFFQSECENFENYIPGVSFTLPHDPTNFCLLSKKERYYGPEGPRYAYASDGENYKFIVLYLGDEICDDSRFKEFIDPVRGCNVYNAAWSVYSQGAKNW